MNKNITDNINEKQMNILHICLTITGIALIQNTIDIYSIKSHSEH